MGACASKHPADNKPKSAIDEFTETSVSQSPESEVIYARNVNKIPNRKICIIGAGPAGIHMASLLIKMGYTSEQIVLLEKENRCCGKSMTVRDTDNPTYSQDGTPNTSLPNHYTVHNIVHEMGTCYLHPEYHIISDLQKEYDPTNKQIPFCAGHVFGTSLNKKYEQDDTINNEIKFSEWALTEVKGKVTQKDIPGIQDKYLSKIYMGAGAAAFEIAVKKYRKVWEEIFGKRAQTKHKVRCFPKKPSRENMKRLDCTFMDFLCANGLESIIPCLVYGQSMQGYGILDRIPAFYGLLWSTPELLRSTGNILRVAVHAPNVIVLSKGYEHLWTQMVLKHKLDIRYNVEVYEYILAIP